MKTQGKMVNYVTVSNGPTLQASCEYDLVSSSKRANIWWGPVIIVQRRLNQRKEPMVGK